LAWPLNYSLHPRVQNVYWRLGVVATLRIKFSEKW
jgi:hypothetical protein